MNAHIAGGGVGGIAGVILASLGSRIGLHLSDTDAASLAVALLGVGAAVFHVVAKAGATIGVFPAMRRFLFGPKPSPAVPRPVADPPAPPAA